MHPLPYTPITFTVEERVSPGAAVDDAVRWRGLGPGQSEAKHRGRQSLDRKGQIPGRKSKEIALPIQQL